MDYKEIGQNVLLFSLLGSLGGLVMARKSPHLTVQLKYMILGGAHLTGFGIPFLFTRQLLLSCSSDSPSKKYRLFSDMFASGFIGSLYSILTFNCNPLLRYLNFQNKLGRSIIWRRGLEFALIGGVCHFLLKLIISTKENLRQFWTNYSQKQSGHHHIAKNLSSRESFPSHHNIGDDKNISSDEEIEKLSLLENLTAQIHNLSSFFSMKNKNHEILKQAIILSNEIKDFESRLDGLKKEVYGLERGGSTG